MARYARWGSFRKLSGRIPVWQARLRSGREACPTSLSSPHLSSFWEYGHSMEQTRQDRTRTRAARLRRREPDRRPHFCGVQLQPLEHKSFATGDPLAEVQREAETGL